MLKDHEKKEWHVRIMDMMQQRKAQCMKKLLQALQENESQKLSEHERDTAHLLHIIYTETVMFVPFRSHENLIELLQIARS